ncbi:citramalate synthase [Leptospirillum ferriphilum]|jgi:2-isopropylmalate synthase|uniref:Citramalate synthase n=2 Tax=Leptospirillum TaxID=179 RepID=A0A094WD27_9BACT|nr:citramalate synthase [Leptospirillum ferriphilum]EDZ38915.1 MAG: 2-isopropylmalate synthase [Leptospirillum sp. Group II '5-way CG']KGA93527.1 (R)-citramalate synthase [Leptospirillum ferriphilum]
MKDETGPPATPVTQGFPENRQVFVYDTTLRDGSQSEDVQFTLEDKIRVAECLDRLGIDYIEGGWPGANPKDIEFFRRIRDVSLTHSRVSAFGSTRKSGNRTTEDAVLRALIDARTPVVTIFGKSWSLHVEDILGISRQANLDMIRESCDFLKQSSREVVYDAEHFFDGFRENPDFALETLRAAEEGGADWIILCDTNGGSMPWEIERAIREVLRSIRKPLGIHAHNDSELAVANSLTAVRAGATQVHGTINGIGERCGNANLVSVIADLILKLEASVTSARELSRLREVASFVFEIQNRPLPKNQPFVGDSAFAHKAGVHVHAIRKNRRAYEHILPEAVGNTQRILLSEHSGRSNLAEKAKEYGIPLDSGSPEAERMLATLKELEHEGYQFEGADASFELLMRSASPEYIPYFEIDFFHVRMEKRGDSEAGLSEATIRVRVGDATEHTAALGNGPVNALDNALRKALGTFYPGVNAITLLDYKVRVLAGAHGTASRVRVLIESAMDSRKWGTVGVSENVITASLLALKDSIVYGLLKSGTVPRG